MQPYGVHTLCSSTHLVAHMSSTQTYRTAGATSSCLCRYDVIVVGIGGMGSAALYHLAKRSRRVSL